MIFCKKRKKKKDTLTKECGVPSLQITKCRVKKTPKMISFRRQISNFAKRLACPTQTVKPTIKSCALNSILRALTLSVSWF